MLCPLHPLHTTKTPSHSGREGSPCLQGCWGEEESSAQEAPISFPNSPAHCTAPVLPVGCWAPLPPSPFAASLDDLTPHKKPHRGNHHLHPTHDPPAQGVGLTRRSWNLLCLRVEIALLICACGYLAIPTDNFWIIIPLPAQLPILVTCPCQENSKRNKIPWNPSTQCSSSELGSFLPKLSD